MNKFVTRVSYEWDLESVDAYDDIIDHDFHDACPAIPTNPNISLVLVRSVANGWSDFFDDSGNIIDRSWAYVRDGVLPETFDCGTAVPKRFQKELARIGK